MAKNDKKFKKNQLFLIFKKSEIFEFFFIFLVPKKKIFWTTKQEKKTKNKENKKIKTTFISISLLTFPTYGAFLIKSRFSKKAFPSRGNDKETFLDPSFLWFL